MAGEYASRPLKEEDPPDRAPFDGTGVATGHATAALSRNDNKSSGIPRLKGSTRPDFR
jgi:hypothetical protein